MVHTQPTIAATTNHQPTTIKDMTNVICLQCWAMLGQIRPAHRDHELYHPPSKHPVHLPAKSTELHAGGIYEGTPPLVGESSCVITYPDSDIQ